MALNDTRISRLLLRAGLLGLAAFVTYCWMIRLSSDLGWDESLNFKTYARHPLTAIALYHEPNNHPLESFVKSIFYGVLGWDSPPVYRFTGFLFVVGYLALVWAWHSELSRRGSLVAASLLTILMLLSNALNWQGTELRGYFLSIVLELFYLLVLVRKTGMLDRGTGSAAGREAWTGRVAVRYAVLSALILFSVPSNLIVMPAMWLLTAAVYHEPEDPLAPTFARRVIRLVLTTALLAAILYTPIVLGILTGISNFHSVPAEKVPETLLAAGAELSLTLEQITPRGWPPAVVGWVLVAAVVSALVLRRRSALTWTAFGIAVACLIPRVAVAAFVDYPSRTKSSFVPPLVLAVAILAHVITVKWSARTQALTALVLVICSYASVPVLLRETQFYRTPSQVAEFLVTVCHPSERHVLVGHDGLQELLHYLRRAFGRDRTVENYVDLRARTGGDAAGKELPEASARRWLRDMVLRQAPVAPLDLAKVDVLVLIDRTSTARESSSWSHPALGTLKARLSRTTVFDLDDYRMTIFEAP